MAELAGRVAVVTGASRGIGRAIALGLAQQGCHVVIAAKSVESTEKLPGSIHSVAKEVEALGVQALPVQVDVRDEAQIERMAAEARTRFGRIDILINNAGALWWQPLSNTPAKRFDLVMSVNARAAFLAARAVLPAMRERRWGHIINMSPPIDLAMVPGKIAYCISKFGMTLLTHGLAEELRPDNVAVNSLWPVTIIESQASINWGLGQRDQWRKPDILVDCVLRLVRKEPSAVTGQALLDEDFLRSEGVTDFSGYACVPGTEPQRVKWAGLEGRRPRPLRSLAHFAGNNVGNAASSGTTYALPLTEIAGQLLCALATKHKEVEDAINRCTSHRSGHCGHGRAEHHVLYHGAHGGHGVFHYRHFKAAHDRLQPDRGNRRTGGGNYPARCGASSSVGLSNCCRPVGKALLFFGRGTAFVISLFAACKVVPALCWGGIRNAQHRTGVSHEQCSCREGTAAAGAPNDGPQKGRPASLPEVRHGASGHGRVQVWQWTQCPSRMLRATADENLSRCALDA